MNDELLDHARRLAQTLSPGDLEETLSRITAAAVEVLPDVTMASITIRHRDNRLETFSPTHDVLCEVDAKQYDLQQGPCYETATDEAYVVSSDLEADPRWPDYTRVALDAGIRAQAGIALFDAPRFQGALDLYSHHVGAFDDLGPLGALFSHQAAVAISYAQEISDLRQAVATRQRIGTAVGVVMERYDLSEERAFAFLARLSQDRNVKLREIANEFTATTDAPDSEGRR
ncbi:GAF and ANTAR domain-containing protein [Nocardioides antri]|uniref:ANTAR domain-containing protein n=1 Tax=Nocardioides antri TaxID=2607659 RepID=A0A5B1M782_9ACTN|nr:GAF and ANTAR domain-containing protein [Nocardioides antri]KAA1428653.1 ANTAR domain-containing protein [Nocardioides antri]